MQPLKTHHIHIFESRNMIYDKITSKTCRFETCRYLKLPNFKLKFISWEQVTFRLRKSECSESLESERFTMSVARVVDCGEKFDNCSWANKWEWISVNGSWISRVGRRCEKPLGHLKLCLFVCAVFQNKTKNCCATPNSLMYCSQSPMKLFYML